MTDHTNRQCGPECSEGHLYAYRCALKPPPVSPWTILGVGAEPEPAVPAPADTELPEIPCLLSGLDRPHDTHDWTDPGGETAHCPGYPEPAPADADRRQRYADVLRRWGLLDEVNDPKATAAFVTTDLLSVADAEQAALTEAFRQLAVALGEKQGRTERERDEARAALDRVRQECAAVPPCVPGTQAEDVAHAKGWNAAMDHVLKALTAPKETRP